MRKPARPAGTMPVVGADGVGGGVVDCWHGAAKRWWGGAGARPPPPPGGGGLKMKIYKSMSGRLWGHDASRV